MMLRHFLAFLALSLMICAVPACSGAPGELKKGEIKNKPGVDPKTGEKTDGTGTTVID